MRVRSCAKAYLNSITIPRIMLPLWHYVTCNFSRIFMKESERIGLLSAKWNNLSICAIGSLCVFRYTSASRGFTLFPILFRRFIFYFGFSFQTLLFHIVSDAVFLCFFVLYIHYRRIVVKGSSKFPILLHFTVGLCRNECFVFIFNLCSRCNELSLLLIIHSNSFYIKWICISVFLLESRINENGIHRSRWTRLLFFPLYDKIGKA